MRGGHVRISRLTPTHTTPRFAPPHSYEDFIYFMLSEEDKLSDTAVTYWFNVLDVDGDGVLSSKDMLYFYEEQSSRLAALGTEPTPFDDILCQLTDAVNPRRLADGRP